MLASVYIRTSAPLRTANQSQAADAHWSEDHTSKRMALRDSGRWTRTDDNSSDNDDDSTREPLEAADWVPDATSTYAFYTASFI